MAAAVLTFNLDQPDKVHLGGGRYLVSGEITTDTGDYATGGLTVAAASFGLDTIDRLIVGHSSILGIDPYWIKSTGKIKVFKDDAGGISAEHAASALTAQSIPFVAIGKKAA